MTDTTEAVAHLTKRAVIATFNEEDASPRVRVNCLNRREIVALVELLRDWQPAGGQKVRVAVTAREPWAGLRVSDIVPSQGESPTTLRNTRGIWVVLIEGDDYTDKQGWQEVLQVSDHDLLEERAAREFLIQILTNREPPAVLLDVLEKVHEILMSSEGGRLPIRNWIDFVRASTRCIERKEILDAPTVWKAVGSVLPEVGLFADERLGDVNETDRQRLLRRNCNESSRIVADSDENWRDRLLEVVERVEFVEPTGEAAVDQEAVRAAAGQVLTTFGREATRGLEFRYWEQIAQGGKPKKGLGARIRDHLSNMHPTRVEEFERLDVESGIDARNPDDAEKLLNYVADGERPSLAALLEKKHRTALERTANPRGPRTRSPLSDLVRVIADMVAERDAVGDEPSDQAPPALLIQPRTTSNENEHSRALFAWLFGKTLKDLILALPDEGYSLRLSDDLLGRIDFHESDEDDATDVNGSSDLFEVLELRLVWLDGLDAEKRIEWDPKETPGLVALWRLCARSEVPYWRPSRESSFDEWLAGSLQSIRMLGGVQDAEEIESHGAATTWDRTRQQYLERLSNEGLSIATIEEYVDEFRIMLSALREQHVPAGAGLPEVETIVRRDFFLGDEGAACLATHPIRLRWIAAYLAKMAHLLESALARKLVTNPVNPDLYFSQILTASPQAQPPVAVFDERLLLAVREQDWHELYAPLKDERGEKRDWLADLDDGAIDDVADTINQYLAAYPYKADGLHLLYIVRRFGARGLRRLVKSILERARAVGTTLTLSLFVDTLEVRAVEEALQDFDDADHRAYSNQPPLRVNLYPWPDPDNGLPDVSPVGPFVDVAVIPNLFGAATRTQESTLAGSRITGTFDPLLDEPTRLEAVRSGSGPSTAVSRVLLPEGQDEILQDWSTIVTRQFRGSPVSDSPDEEDIDHITIRVSLDRNREFFDALHACSHWVVTVDAFVGREQIEALKDGPDVIRVKTGVGANGGYRLVVSSKVGREFVQARVARRLREQLSSSVLPNPDAPAVEIYDRASKLVPGIVLRSLGLGRTTAEMVGLVLARSRIEQAEPAVVGASGFQSWISLDEHVEWSGGHTKVRADLVRFVGRVDGGTLKLQIDVVEAKMRRQVQVGRADAQLDRSIALLTAAFGGDGENNVDYVDKDVWSRLIWRAIEQSSAAADATPAATHVVSSSERQVGLDPSMKADLRECKCEIESIRGVLVSLTDDTVARDGVTPSGHRWLRMTMDEVAETIKRFTEPGTYPLHSDGSSEATRPPRTSVLHEDSAGDTRHVESSPAGPSLTESSNPQVRGGATATARKRLQDLIDALLTRKVEVRPASEDEALEGPGFYLFRIVLGPGVRPQAVTSLAEDLQYQLGLEAGQIPRIYVDRGAMVVEIPKRDEERYYVSADDLWNEFEWRSDRLVAPLGRDVRDRPVAVDFSSNRSPHLLIGGMTGGGKSVALEALLLGLVRHYSPSQLELRIVDPKGNEFTAFEKLPHVGKPLGMDADDAIEILERTCEQMDERYREMKRLSQERNTSVRDITSYNALVGPNAAFKWIVIVLDEFADLTSDKEDKKAIEGLLQRIAQKARACGIHAIVATQKPSAEVISTTTRSNLGAQLALRVRSAIDSKVIMEATGAESLAGNGDGFLRLSGEEPVRLQCAKVD